MIDFVAFQAAIRAWVLAVLGSATPYGMKDDGGPFQVTSSGPNTVRIETDEPAVIGSIGIDEQRWTEDPLTHAPICSVFGNRELQVTVRARGRTHTGNPAQTAIGKLKTSLKMQSVLDAFHAAGIAVIRSGPVQNYNAPFDNRVEAIASFVLTTSVGVLDTDAVSTGQIDTVGLSSALQGTNGATLPVPPNFTDEIIGPVP